MTSTSHNLALSAEDICRILLTCGKAKVAELQFGPLCVRFGAQAIDEDVPRGTLRTSKSLPPTQAKEMAEQQTQIAEKSLAEQEYELRLDQLAQLMIEDPAKAEELIINGDLEETTNGDRAEEA
jgi:hypothetical protein